MKHYRHQIKSFLQDYRDDIIKQYALVNYKRSERKYLGLIISIFILCLVLNSLMIFSHYMSDVFDCILGYLRS